MLIKTAPELYTASDHSTRGANLVGMHSSHLNMCTRPLDVAAANNPGECIANLLGIAVSASAVNTPTAAPLSLNTDTPRLRSPTHTASPAGDHAGLKGITHRPVLLLCLMDTCTWQQQQQRVLSVRVIDAGHAQCNRVANTINQQHTNHRAKLLHNIYCWSGTPHCVQAQPFTTVPATCSTGTHQSMQCSDLTPRHPLIHVHSPLIHVHAAQVRQVP